MDARAVALTVLVGLHAGAVSASPAARDSFAAGVHDAHPVRLDLHEADVEKTLDAGTLADLDDLLLDLVELNGGDLERLRGIPWLGTQEIAALREARPYGSIADLRRVRGWDAELVRSIRAFVRVEPRTSRRPSWGAEVRTSVLRSRREVRLRGQGPVSRLALRFVPGEPRARSGFWMLHGRGVGAIVGDVRVSHAQGLLWWSSQVDPRAGSAPLRRARGLMGFDGAWRARVLRGAGLELRRGRWNVVLVAGEHATGGVLGGTMTCECARVMRLQTALLQVGTRRLASVGLTGGSSAGEVALEVAGTPGRAGASLAAALRSGSLRIGARMQVTPAGAVGGLAALGRPDRTADSRHALVRAAARHGKWRLEVAVAQSSRHDSVGTRLDAVEHKARAVWSAAGNSLEIRLRRRRTRQASVGVETRLPLDERRTRAAVLRVRRDLDTRSAVWLEYRAIESLELREPARTGSAWQLRFEHRRGPLRATFALTAFEAPSGTAAPVVPEPGVGGGVAARRLHGDGLRAAVGLRLGSSRSDWRLRLATQSVAQEPADLELETSFRLRSR